jgi:hypothetical protein
MIFRPRSIAPSRQAGEADGCRAHQKSRNGHKAGLAVRLLEEKRECSADCASEDGTAFCVVFVWQKFKEMNEKHPKLDRSHY